MNQPISPELMSLAAYVAEDGLVSHHWEEGPLVLRRFYDPGQVNAKTKIWEWVGRGARQGNGIGDFSR